MGVYIGSTLQGDWAQVFTDCCIAAKKPHPPAQDSLPRLLSHSVKGESAGRALAKAWGSGPGIQEEAVSLL